MNEVLLLCSTEHNYLQPVCKLDFYKVSLVNWCSYKYMFNTFILDSSYYWFDSIELVKLFCYIWSFIVYIHLSKLMHELQNCQEYNVIMFWH